MREFGDFANRKVFAGSSSISNNVVLPLLTVTNATVTNFSSEGIDYIEIYFASSGSFSIEEGTIDSFRYALGAGGGNGGRAANNTWVPGGGGGGGLLMVNNDVSFTEGDYTVTIGAGAPSNSVTGGGSNGSNSSIIGNGVSLIALGGGRGAASGTGSNVGSDGGSGGGGRGSASGANSAGLGTPGQGFDGGTGFNSEDPNLRVSGAGGPGGNGAGGVALTQSSGGRILWTSTIRTVCRGGAGITGAATGNSQNRNWGFGSEGSINGTVGRGGNGFLFIRVRADQVRLVTQ